MVDYTRVGWHQEANGQWIELTKLWIVSKRNAHGWIEHTIHETWSPCTVEEGDSQPTIRAADPMGLILFQHLRQQYVQPTAPTNPAPASALTNAADESDTNPAPEKQATVSVAEGSEGGVGSHECGAGSHESRCKGGAGEHGKGFGKGGAGEHGEQGKGCEKGDIGSGIGMGPDSDYGTEVQDSQSYGKNNSKGIDDDNADSQRYAPY